MRHKRSGRESGRSKRNFFGKLIVFLSVLALGLFSSIYYVKAQMEDVVNTEIFYPGITVEGVYLEGMSYEEAEQAILEKLAEDISRYHLVIKYGDQAWEFDHSDLRVRSNLQEVLQQAYSTGRTGALFHRYNTVRNLKDNPISFDVSLLFSVEELREQLQIIAEAVNREPEDAAIEFHPDKKDKFTITDEKEGLAVNVDKLMADIQKAFASGTSVVVELQPEKIAPVVHAKDLMLQTKKIASFSTEVTGTASRKSNVYHAAAQFNGMVIHPGETVSFNATTGERTIANGYKNAPVIAADKSLQDDLGGGVCQTSSTIYNAVLRAGLKIEERWHHSFPSTYVPKGHDATVNWPNVDFKFSNNKDTPVYIHTYRSGERLYVDIYGKEAEEYDEIKLESDVYAQYKEPAPNIVKDTSQKYVVYTDQTYTKVPSRPGYKVKTYRVYYKDGKEVSRELISDDYYRPITGTVYVGVKERTPTVDRNTDVVYED